LIGHFFADFAYTDIISFQVLIVEILFPKIQSPPSTQQGTEERVEHRHEFRPEIFDAAARSSFPTCATPRATARPPATPTTPIWVCGGTGSSRPARTGSGAGGRRGAVLGVDAPGAKGQRPHRHPPLSTLSSFYKWALKHEIVEADPVYLATSRNARCGFRCGWEKEDRPAGSDHQEPGEHPDHIFGDNKAR